ncbi:MAG: hypothetical protein H6559_37565 [Lewinellaceae bacterium]|nr:hypothetical protein [Lewinellaceae bacterium]
MPVNGKINMRFEKRIAKSLPHTLTYRPDSFQPEKYRQRILSRQAQWHTGQYAVAAFKRFFPKITAIRLTSVGQSGWNQWV